MLRTRVNIEKGKKIRVQFKYSNSFYDSVDFEKDNFGNEVINYYFIDLIAKEDLVQLYKVFNEEQLRRYRINFIRLINTIKRYSNFFKYEPLQNEYFNYVIDSNGKIFIIYNKKIKDIINDSSFLYNFIKKLVSVKIEFNGFEK